MHGSRTGAVEKRYDLCPTSRGNAPGDIAISPTGELYISDSRSGILYAIRPSADSLEVLVADGTFMPPQGQALGADGKTLYVADYVRGDHFHFIANSGWDGFGDDGSLLKDHRLTPPAVLSIKLNFWNTKLAPVISGPGLGYFYMHDQAVRSRRPASGHC